MQCLITAIIAVILLVGAASSCPGVCGCFNTSNGVNVSCSSRGLVSIPTDLPTNTQDFYLDHNNITSIKSDTFNNLTNLEKLSLQYNDISVIENNAFNNLPSLYQLRLNNNNISVIENNAFTNLPSLQYIRMDNNPIAFVSEYAFVNLPNLTSLAFDMYCGSCGNIPFWRWLIGYHTFNISITCKDFDGKHLHEVPLNNDPDSSDGPRQVVIYPTTSNYTRNETLDGVGPINCTANCQPACTSTWNGPNIPPGTTSVLSVANINRNQAGNYQCTVSNDVSSLISATVYVVVNYQPTISNISNDKEVNENDTATISCIVDSIPQSLIRWIFETKELQNKYDGSLTLNKIDCLSMGRYTCQAVNMLGGDNRYVDVKVKCSPRINSIEFTIPSTIAVKDKGILNITAHMIAFPKPEMYWQFVRNGSYLNVSSGITNSFNSNRHSSNLVKSNLIAEDFGTYSVYAYNGVGSTHYLLHSVVVVPVSISNENKDQSVIIGAGAGVGSVIAILLIIGVIVFLLKRRRDCSPGHDKKLMKRPSSNKEDIPTYNEANNIDGLHPNPIYVPAEARPNERTRKKMKTEKTDTAIEEGHVYSQVRKKDKKDKMEIEMEGVHENSEDVANSRADALRANEKVTMEKKQHQKHQPNMNKDGLAYADVELSPGPSGKQFVIRGLENRNNYAIIDLTKTAEPLPSDSESENEKEKTEANG